MSPLQSSAHVGRWWLVPTTDKNLLLTSPDQCSILYGSWVQNPPETFFFSFFFSISPPPHPLFHPLFFFLVFLVLSFSFFPLFLSPLFFSSPSSFFLPFTFSFPLPFLSIPSPPFFIFPLFILSLALHHG